MARNFLARKTEAGCPPRDMIAVHNLLDSDMFPSLKAINQVGFTVPVSSCSCERSFSALRRLHSWLRKTMGQTRLHGGCPRHKLHALNRRRKVAWGVWSEKSLAVAIRYIW